MVRRPHHQPLHGNGGNGYVIDDFNSDNFDHTGLGFFGGGKITCLDNGALPITQLGLPPGTASWGSGWKAAARQYYNRQISFGSECESPSYRQNYVDLDPTYRDVWGDPLVRGTFNYTDNERRMVRYIAEKAHARILTAMNPAIQVVNDTVTDFDVVPYQSTHISGGTIMGSDPSTSVVNKYCQVWDVPNLFVVGASNFPQNAGNNPTGTVGALAYHAAEALVTRYIPDPGSLA